MSTKTKQAKAKKRRKGYEKKRNIARNKPKYKPTKKEIKRREKAAGNRIKTATGR